MSEEPRIARLDLHGGERSSLSKVTVRCSVISTRWLGPATVISWLAIIEAPLWTKVKVGSFEMTNCRIPKRNLPTDSWP